MYAALAALALIQGAEDQSVWKNILSSIPTDGASVFVLSLAVCSVVFVLVTGHGGGGKKKGDQGGKGTSAP